MLAAASSLFTERGFEETTIEAIAELAETGVGTVYGYFASKEEILREVVRESAQEGLAVMSASMAPGMPVIERICLSLEQLAKYFAANRRLMMDIYRVSTTYPEVNAESTASLVEAFRRMIGKGIDDGEFAEVPVETTARVLVAAHIEAMLRIHVWGDVTSDEAALGELRALTVALLAPGSTRRGLA